MSLSLFFSILSQHLIPSTICSYFHFFSPTSASVSLLCYGLNPISLGGPNLYLLMVRSHLISQSDMVFFKVPASVPFSLPYTPVISLSVINPTSLTCSAMSMILSSFSLLNLIPFHLRIPLSLPSNPVLICSWLITNKLLINDSKTEFLIVGTRQQVSKIYIDSISIGNSRISSSNVVKNLGTLLDNTLSMSTQVSKVASSCFYSIYNIRRIRKYLSKEVCETLVNARGLQIG